MFRLKASLQLRVWLRRWLLFAVVLLPVVTYFSYAAAETGITASLSSKPGRLALAPAFYLWSALGLGGANLSVFTPFAYASILFSALLWSGLLVLLLRATAALTMRSGGSAPRAV